MGFFSSKKAEEPEYIVTRSGYRYGRDDDEWRFLNGCCRETFGTATLDDAFEIMAPLLMQKFDKLDKLDLIVQQNEELKQRCAVLEEKINKLENRSR